MTQQKVTNLKDVLCPSAWSADSNIYVNVTRKRLSVSAPVPNGVSFQATVSEVLLIVCFF